MSGCSNHGCYIERPKGMGTNGRCHCLDSLELNDLLSAASHRLLGAALDVLQKDPHQWSVRPCQTCRSVETAGWVKLKLM